MAQAHTPAADVAAAGAAPAVNPPRTIPLSVEMASALNIKGFEHIKSEGPIGFITVDQGGRVWFEGKELTQNAQNLCASGNVPAPGSASAAARAPDGSAYSAMPGQAGLQTASSAGVQTYGTGTSRMQPIVDGPSYKTPPKRKKAAPKKVEDDTVTEETMPEDGTTSALPDSTTPATGDDDLKSMMRKSDAADKPAADPVPMAPKTTPAGDSSSAAEPEPTEPQTGAAVQEVLDN